MTVIYTTYRRSLTEAGMRMIHQVREEILNEIKALRRREKEATWSDLSKAANKYRDLVDELMQANEAIRKGVIDCRKKENLYWIVVGPLGNRARERGWEPTLLLIGSPKQCIVTTDDGHWNCVIVSDMEPYYDPADPTGDKTGNVIWGNKMKKEGTNEGA